jgi:hypothetical protein
MQLFHAAGAAHGIDATNLTAAASKAGQLNRWMAGPGGDDRSMSPFASKATMAVDQLAVDNQATADAGTENDSEDNAMATPGANSGFRQDATVSIIGNQYRHPERGFEIPPQPPAVDAGHVGDHGPLSFGINNAGNRYGDASRRASSLGYHRFKGGNEGSKVARWCRAAWKGTDVVNRVGEGALYGGTAYVEADDHEAT